MYEAGDFRNLQAKRQHLEDRLLRAQTHHSVARIGRFILAGGAIAELVVTENHPVALLFAGMALGAHLAVRPLGDNAIQLDFAASGAEREIDRHIGLNPELDQ